MSERRRRSEKTRFAALVAVALVATGCAGTLPVDRQVALPDPPKQGETITPAQREHQRILTGYGGATVLGKSLE